MLPRYETTVEILEAPQSHLDSSSSSSLGDPHHEPIPTHSHPRLRRGLDWVVTGFFAIKEATILISAHGIIAIRDDHHDERSPLPLLARGHALFHRSTAIPTHPSKRSIGPSDIRSSRAPRGHLVHAPDPTHPRDHRRPPPTMPSASASGADASKDGARHRQHNQGNQDRSYTAEQKRAVLRIRACEPTAFYEILELSKSCSDSEVKKAYRKQSLLTHPDKNGHEHADEAFKMVARAFGVLGDKDKRDKFDRFGTDPDSRFGSGGGGGGGGGGQQGNPFAGFANARRGGWGEEEISPEEMFARFFGGGGPFGQGGGEFSSSPPTSGGLVN